MLQRWMKSLAVVATTCILATSCKQHTFSPDEPLTDTHTPSVFISSQNKILYAMDPNTGKAKWQLKLYNNVIATPVVAGDSLYLPTDDTLYKINAKTGVITKRIIVRRADPDNPSDTINVMRGFHSSPLTDGKTVWIASRRGWVFALDVKNDNVKWEVNIKDSIYASLMSYSGNLIVVTDDGVVSALNLNSGAQNWVNNSSLLAFRLVSSPVASGTNIYICTPEGVLFALNGLNGKEIWKYTVGGVIDGSPIVYGGNIIYGCADNYIYCIDSTAKAIRWRYKTNDRVLSTPAASGQVVFVGGYDSYIYALNILDGSVKWKYKTGALIQAAPLVVGSSLYVAGFDKHLYKFDTAGVFKWKHDIGGPIETSPILYDLTRTYYPSITGMGQY